MTPNRLITLAIHTYERAIPIKNLLEGEGVYVELNNVNLDNPVISAGVRIRVREADLPFALRIVENYEIFAFPEGTAMTEKCKILVPTDFSDGAFKAVFPAVNLAHKLNCEVEYLHAYLSPINQETVQLSDSYDYELVDIEASRMMQMEADKMMRRFSERVKGMMKDGSIPAVKFSTQIVEGLPEEAILGYIRQTKPLMVVMGTRAAEKKESELIGSVTAEVLDSCRVPAITVPETVEENFFNRIKRVAFFCNLDQEDLLALDTLHRYFPDRKLDVTLIPVPQRRSLRRPFFSKGTEENLLKYCREHYSEYSFNASAKVMPLNAEQFRAEAGHDDYDLLCMPSKHKNVVARVFNPSLAHRILFQTDIPMVVVPV